MLSKNEQKERKAQIAAIAGTILFHALIVVSLMVLALHSKIPIQKNDNVEVNFSSAFDSIGGNESRQKSMKMDSAVHPIQIKAGKQTVTEHKEKYPIVERVDKKTVRSGNTPVVIPAAIVETPQEQTIIKKKVDRSKPTNTELHVKLEENPTGGKSTLKNEDPTVSKEIASVEKANGISYSLIGCASVKIQKPVYDPSVQGIIIVSIIVNKEGKVIYAKAGAKGSTITEIHQIQMAEAAARKSEFSVAPGAPDEQKGTISYVFGKQK
jgi:hypothetical protein